ncbi:hypothetical protein [Streptomyces sp. NBC_00343]|uniref:hypothetical protein n=1 Tax=Streptomyces sp. NBC_00343 TaxID=2975719 RepID=UPI002E297D96|nr:hypothetical protein [Streptomyces sp. NBC_00343]
MTDDRNTRADELDRLADDLESLLTYEDPFTADHRGPFLANSDTEHPGYEAIARYARERAEWLRSN